MNSHYTLTLAACLFAATPSMAAITTYISAPGVVSAEDTDPAFDGVTTVNFNSTSTGQIDNDEGITFDIATYKGTGVIYENDQYGGNDGNYLGIQASQSVTITFSQPIRYFGLYFTAGDSYNTFELKSGGSTIGIVTTQNVIETIPNDPLTTISTIGGDTYHTEDYFSQPETGLNPSEPYAYFHIFGDFFTTFDEIILTQGAGSGSARFESDNHSWSTSVIPVPDPVIPVIPEPSTLMLSLSCLSIFVIRRHRPQA